MRLKDKVALITGGARSIGAAFFDLAPIVEISRGSYERLFSINVVDSR